MIDKYRADSSHNYFLKIPKYKSILDAMWSDSYPKYNLIDDVVHWAEHSQLINTKTVEAIWAKIKEVRQPIFFDNINSDDDKIEIIHLFLEKSRFIYHADAQELLFPDLNIWPELNLSVQNESIDACRSNNVIYFNTKSLIKWLMKNGHLSEALTNELLALKIESIKENIFEYKGKFDSLTVLTKQGTDRNNILSDALNGNIDIFLKYPRDFLHWREVNTNINQHKILDTLREFSALRYDGLGKLKKKRNDDSHLCQFGGLTIDMLLYGERPIHGLSKRFQLQLKSDLEYGHFFNDKIVFNLSLFKGLHGS